MWNIVVLQIATMKSAFLLIVFAFWSAFAQEEGTSSELALSVKHDANLTLKRCILVTPETASLVNLCKRKPYLALCQDEASSFENSRQNVEKMPKGLGGKADVTIARESTENLARKKREISTGMAFLRMLTHSLSTLSL